jgi:PPOX class probable FMN-dependent enzyme
MTDWLAILKQSVSGEWENPPIIAALATADSNGNPHVRHVICRRIDDNGNIIITSDSRSAKNQHIRAKPNVELSLWLPQKREQFRIAGTISLDPRREEIWRDLSNSTRATFFWPPPADPRNPDQVFADAVPATVNPPANFEVLLLTPEQVEHLELSPHPHRRRRWCRSSNWILEELNP